MTPELVSLKMKKKEKRNYNVRDRSEALAIAREAMKERQQTGERPDFTALSKKYNASPATVEGWFEKLAVWGEAWFVPATTKKKNAHSARLAELEARIVILEKKLQDLGN